MKDFRTKIWLDLRVTLIKLQCDEFTGCDEMDDYFTTETDTIIDIVYEDDLVKPV